MGGTLALRLLRVPFAPDVPVYLIQSGIGGLAGAPFGAAAGAWFWIGVVQLARGPASRKRGALLGFLGGVLAGVPLLLAVPQWYFERMGEWAIVCVLAAMAVLGAVVGAVAGDVYSKAEGPARKRVLAGALALLGVLALGAALGLGSVGGHARSVEDLAAQGDVEGLIRKLQTGGQGQSHRMRSVTDVRSEAARALGQSGDKRALPALIAALASTSGSDDGLRRAAAEALGNLGDKEAVPALIQAVDRVRGADYGDPCAAAEALGKLGDKEAVPALIEALERGGPNGEGPAVVNIIVALGKLRDPGAVPVLLERFHSFKGSTRTNVTEVPEAAGQALAAIGGPEIVAAVVAKLSDSDPEMRQVATRTLGPLAQAGQPGAMAALMECLKNPEWTVRYNAAEALGRAGAAAVPALIGTLKDKDPAVRATAARSLGNIGDERAKEPLRAAAKDENEGVRLAATQALKQRGW
jgi:HEAT repeat protein